MTTDWEGIAKQLAAEQAEHRAEMTRNRDLVLANPEAAKRLTAEPLNYAKPEQWNGYVPPELWNGAHNDSARRAALLEILAAAHEASA